MHKRAHTSQRHDIDKGGGGKNSRVDNIIDLVHLLSISLTTVPNHIDYFSLGHSLFHAFVPFQSLSALVPSRNWAIKSIATNLKYFWLSYSIKLEIQCRPITFFAENICHHADCDLLSNDSKWWSTAGKQIFQIHNIIFLSKTHFVFLRFAIIPWFNKTVFIVVVCVCTVF